jgi:hypothetical protein
MRMIRWEDLVDKTARGKNFPTLPKERKKVKLGPKERHLLSILAKLRTSHIDVKSYLIKTEKPDTRIC